MERRALTEKERRDWLRLFRSRHVGPATFQALLQHAGDISGAIEIAPELSRRGGRKRAISIISETEAEDEIAAAINLGARIIALCEPEYPDALAAIHDPPPVLTVLGDPAKLSGPAIAIIGARNASAAGRRFARDIAAELGQSGLVVASGLARGIDTAAHEGSLATGTVAVLAGGVDVCYPDENRTLYDRIAEGGGHYQRTKTGDKTDSAAFSAAQPADFWSFPWRCDRRGRVTLRFADNRPHGARTGARGLCRSRLSRRSPSSRHQQADPRRCTAYRARGRRA